MSREHNVWNSLSVLRQTKEDIKQAIISKGVWPDPGLINYAEAIRRIKGGGVVPRFYSNVKFGGSHGLVKVPPFIIEGATDFSSMYYNCSMLSEVDVWGYNMDSVETLSNMFGYCGNLERVNGMSYWNLLNVSNMRQMFVKCEKLDGLPKKLKFGKVEDAYGMFEFCESLSTLESLEFVEVGDVSHMFYNCSNLRKMNISGTHHSKNFSGMFTDCINLEEVGGLQTDGAESLYEMFRGCEKLKSIPKLNIQNVKNITSAFYGCESLVSVSLIGDNKRPLSGNELFYLCYNLEEINIENTLYIDDGYRMFRGCYKLRRCPNIDTSAATDLNSMFYNCDSLEYIPLLDCGGVTDMYGISYLLYGDKPYLTDVSGFKDLKVNWRGYGSLEYAPNLTVQSLMNVIDNLYDFVGNGESTICVLGLGETNLSKLTPEQIVIATNKGWELQ